LGEHVEPALVGEVPARLRVGQVLADAAREREDAHEALEDRERQGDPARLDPAQALPAQAQQAREEVLREAVLLPQRLDLGPRLVDRGEAAGKLLLELAQVAREEEVVGDGGGSGRLAQKGVVLT
jgi:hypothetical protein